MSVSIRSTDASDAAVLAELAAATFPLACPPSTTQDAIAAFIATNLSEERFAGYLADPQRLLLIAEDESGAALGYTMLIFGEPADTDVAAAVTLAPIVELSKFYTLPHTHGGSVSAPLMQATLAAAADRGVQGAWLGVNNENARAIRFYEKNGFARVGTKTFKLGDRYEHDFVLERALP